MVSKKTAAARAQLNAFFLTFYSFCQLFFKTLMSSNYIDEMPAPLLEEHDFHFIISIKLI